MVAVVLQTEVAFFLKIGPCGIDSRKLRSTHQLIPLTGTILIFNNYLTILLVDNMLILDNYLG